MLPESDHAYRLPNVATPRSRHWGRGMLVFCIARMAVWRQGRRWKVLDVLIISGIRGRAIKVQESNRPVGVVTGVVGGSGQRGSRKNVTFPRPLPVAPSANPLQSPARIRSGIGRVFASTGPSGAPSRSHNVFYTTPTATGRDARSRRSGRSQESIMGMVAEKMRADMRPRPIITYLRCGGSSRSTRR